MTIFKKLISLCALILIISFMHLQSMEVGESDYGLLNAHAQECYEQLMQENNNDVTKSLLQITKKFSTFVSKVEEPQALAVTKKLIENEADVNGIAKYKATPLIFAVMNKNQKLADLLISHGAYVNGNPTKELVPLDGNTPLMEAIVQDDLDMVRFLIDKAGANVNFQDPRCGQTALHTATQFAEIYINKISIIKFLLSKKADYTIPDHEGNTPLSIAQQYPTNDIENLLLTGEYQLERSDRQRIRDLGLSVMRSSLSNLWQTQSSASSLTEYATSFPRSATSSETRSDQSPQGEYSTANGHTFMSTSFQPATPFENAQALHRYRLLHVGSDSEDWNRRRIVESFLFDPAHFMPTSVPPALLQSTIYQLANPSYSSSDEYDSTYDEEDYNHLNLEPIQQQSSERYPKQSRHNWENIQELSSKIKKASESSEPKKILDINLPNKQTGKTLLMIAAKKGNISVINYLLKHNADAGIFDSKRKTALNHAFENKHQECIEALIIPTGLAFTKPKDLALYEKYLD
jgi:ankyrin repeat protein